jgi:hypothetical protein
MNVAVGRTDQSRSGKRLLVGATGPWPPEWPHAGRFDRSSSFSNRTSLACAVDCLLLGSAVQMTVLEVLGRAGNVEIIHRGTDPCLAVVIVMLRTGPAILMERTYREKLMWIENPTSEQIAQAREGDVWKLWAAENAVDLDGAL